MQGEVQLSRTDAGIHVDVALLNESSKQIIGDELL
jgi:hypothetical protein